MLALLLLPTAAADLDASERALVDQTVAVGVGADASLLNPTAGLGLLWDPDGGDGTTPMGGDWLLEGRPYEALVLSASVDGEAKTWGGEGFVMRWELAADGPEVSALLGTYEDEAIVIRTWIVLWAGVDGVGALTEVRALVPLTELWLMRAADPEPDAVFTGSGDTLNTGGEGYASAAGSWDGRALALASPTGLGGVCSRCEDAEAVLSGDAGPVTSDGAIGVAVEVGDLAAGDTVEVPFAYALDLDADAAADAAEALAAGLTADLDGDGWSAEQGDCDEGQGDISPGAMERYDGLDDDCDGLTDEGTVGSDDDGDGYSEAMGDCDDGDAQVYPGAAAGADEQDADCDGVADGGVPYSLDTGEGEEVGACSHTSGGAGWGLVAMGLLMSARRRR